MVKNAGGNLQYGPRIRLVRRIYSPNAATPLSARQSQPPAFFSFLPVGFHSKRETAHSLLPNFLLVNLCQTLTYIHTFLSSLINVLIKMSLGDVTQFINDYRARLSIVRSHRHTRAREKLGRGKFVIYSTFISWQPSIKMLWRKLTSKFETIKRTLTGKLKIFVRFHTDAGI